MQELQEVHSVSVRLTTLRLKNSKHFRPAATGYSKDLDLIKTKVFMEEAEIKCQNSVSAGFIASSASYELKDAQKRAVFEAIERSTLQSWWSMREKWDSKLGTEDTRKTHDEFFNNQDIDLSIGFIKPVSETGYLAIAIIETANTYPYIVAGSSFQLDPLEAANHAAIEAVQSLNASRWIKLNTPMQTVYWDIGELRLRKKALQKIPNIPIKPMRQAEYPIDFISKTYKFETLKIGNKHIAYVYQNADISKKNRTIVKTPFNH